MNETKFEENLGKNLATVRESLAAGRMDEAEQLLRATKADFAVRKKQLEAPASPALSLDRGQLPRAKAIVPLFRFGNFASRLGDTAFVADFVASHADRALSPEFIEAFCAELDRRTAASRGDEESLAALTPEIEAAEARVALFSRFLVIFRMQALARLNVAEVFWESLSRVADELSEFASLGTTAARAGFWLEREQGLRSLVEILTPQRPIEVAPVITEPTSSL